MLSFFLYSNDRGIFSAGGVCVLVCVSVMQTSPHTRDKQILNISFSYTVAQGNKLAPKGVDITIFPFHITHPTTKTKKKPPG